MAYISKKGNTYRVRWREGGKLHAKGYPTEEEAQAALEAKVRELEAAWVLDPRRNPDYVDLFGDTRPLAAEDPAHSLQGYSRTMILANRDLRQTTREAYLRHLRVHLEGTDLGLTDIRSVTPEMLTAYWAGLTCGGGALGNIVRLLKVTFRRAVSTGLLEANPLDRCPEIKKPRTAVRGPVRPLTVEEVERLADAASSPRDRLEVLVMAYGGLRAGEVGGLQPADVDEKRCQLHVRQSVSRTSDGMSLGPVKTRAARRVVTLPCSIMEEIVELLREDPGTTVFHGQNGGLRDHIRINTSVQRAAKRAGVQTHAHALRHTAVSLWISDGASPTDVQHMVGHEDIATTLGLYSHMFTFGGADLAARMEARREEHWAGHV